MEDAIDLDLDAAAGLASLASSGAVAPSRKGKPRAPRKTAAATKPKKALTPEQRARESAKRKGRRHAADARDEAAAQAATAAAAQQEFTNARVAAVTREALYMLGASRLSGECSPDVSVVAPSTPAPAPIDLNATLVVGGSSSGGARKRARQTPTGGLPDARNLFEEMSSAVDEDYMQHLIFEGGAPGAGYDPEETQSQDGRGAFTPATGYDPYQAAFMHDQVQNNGKCFNLSHCYRVINDEEKFKAQYAVLKARGGKGAMEDVGEGEPARPRGKTNSKKEDKQNAATNALIASVDDMMNKKDSREEERRRFKEEQMSAFMEI
ncbi:hypothetical protein VPH35_083450 [Triticum aestivum]